MHFSSALEISDSTDLARAEGVEWDLHLLCDGFGGQRLADARAAAEQDDDPAAFAVDEVVKVDLRGFDLGLGKGQEQVFLLVRQHEVGERAEDPAQLRVLAEQVLGVLQPLLGRQARRRVDDLEPGLVQRGLAAGDALLDAVELDRGRADCDLRAGLVDLVGHLVGDHAELPPPRRGIEASRDLRAQGGVTGTIGRGHQLTRFVRRRRVGGERRRGRSSRG